MTQEYFKRLQALQSGSYAQENYFLKIAISANNTCTAYL